MSVHVRTIDGERVAFILADPPDDAPAEVREGIARRNVVATGGTCPCGARMVLPNRGERRRAVREHRAIEVDVVHEDGCPAPTSTLTDAIARWRQ